MNDDKQRAADEVLDQAAALPREVAPQRDLWPEIEAAINQEARTPPVGRLRWRWEAPLALAASLLVAVALGFWLGQTGDPRPAGAGTAQPDGRQAVSLTESVGLVDARRTMVADIEAGLDRLPPDAREVVLDNLEAICRALDEIDDVLAEAPATGLDRQLLLSMYVDQLTLLNGLHAMVRGAGQQANQEILL